MIIFRGALNRLPDSGWAAKKGLAAVLVLAALAAQTASANEMMTLFQPQVGQVRSSFSLSSDYAGSQEICDQDQELAAWTSEFSATLPLHQNQRQEWTAHLAAGYRRLDTGAVLPRSGLALPDDLWDLRAGLSHRFQDQRGWIWGGSASFGSASDRPFGSFDESFLMANASLLVPAKGGDAWFFLLNYSSNRTFLRHIPIPGVGYIHNPGPNLWLAVGVPFFILQAKPAERWSVRVSYFPVIQGTAGVSYRLTGPVLLLAGFSSREETHWLASRPDPDTRLYTTRQRFYSGLRVSAARGVVLELTGGWGFGRQYYLGDGYGDDDDGLKVKPGWFAGLSVQIRL